MLGNFHSFLSADKFEQLIDALTHTDRTMVFKNTAFLLILSLIICNDAITVQQSPCQIQSFYAREIGSGEGNLLRVHLDTAGIPTNVSISGSCDSTKIKFSKFIEERRAINGSNFAVSFHWEIDKNYVLAVKEGKLIIKFDSGKETSDSHWFILKSCDKRNSALVELKTMTTPHLYVKYGSSGNPFMEASTDRRAWFEILSSAC